MKTVETVTKPQVTEAKPSMIVPAGAKRQLNSLIKKGNTKVTEATTASELATAVAGIQTVVAITGIKLHNDGKLSPLGHMTSKGNGKLDRALLACTKTLDFGAVAKAVAKGEQKGRKSKLDDNKAMLLRMRDHFKYLAGKSSDHKEFNKRLAKVGLADKADAIKTGFVPAYNIFVKFVSGCIAAK